MIRPRHKTTLLALLVLSCVAGCRSTAQQKHDADREAYELVASRRAKLQIGEPSFTIEPDPQSLRQRLLRGEVPDPGTLTLVQCLQIAAENSRDYQSRKERLYLVALDLTLERWRFALQVGRRTPEFTSQVTGVGDEANESGDDRASANLGLTKLLGTGASIVGNIGLALVRSLSVSTDGWHPVGDLSLGITQPLMRGFGEDIVKEPLTQAERDLVYEVRSFERFRRTFAFETASRYWRLLETADEVKNQENDVANLEKLSARNAALAKSGRLSDIEVGQAQQNELRSRNQLIDARARLARQLDDFKFFLGLPIAVELAADHAELEALVAAADSEKLPEERTAIAFALSHRLDHDNVLDQFDDARRRVVVAEDSLRTGLDLAGSVNVPSALDKPLKYDFRNASWSATLTWDLPIDRLPERNVYRASLIGVQAAARSCQASEDTIRADLRDELRTTATSREGWQIQLRAVELAQRRIESTELKQAAGRADTRDLLEAQESLLAAQNAATSALIDYTLARLALWRDMELLRIDEQGLRVDEDSLLGTDDAAGAPPVEG